MNTHQLAAILMSGPNIPVVVIDEDGDYQVIHKTLLKMAFVNNELKNNPELASYLYRDGSELRTSPVQVIYLR